MRKILFSNSIVKNLQSEIPFVSFDEIQLETDRKLINLGNNISPFDFPEDFINKLYENTGSLFQNYGDPTNLEIRNLLSQQLKLSIENILLSSGIDSLLCLISRTFVEPGDLVITTHGTYPTFEYFIKSAGGEIKYADYTKDYHLNLDQILDLTKKYKIKIVYLVNPDNPTGTVIDKTTLMEFISILDQGTLLILDEAYADFLPLGNKINDDKIFDNVIRLRTFSKAYGIAGLRIGYAITNDNLFKEMSKVRIQFEVNIFAQLVAKKLLLQNEIAVNNVKATREILNFLYNACTKSGMSPISSSANFMCIDFGNPIRANAIKDLLLQQYGIFIRKPTVRTLASLIRVSVGRENDIIYLLECLNEINSNPNLLKLKSTSSTTQSL